MQVLNVYLTVLFKNRTALYKHQFSNSHHLSTSTTFGHSSCSKRLSTQRDLAADAHDAWKSLGQLQRTVDSQIRGNRCHRCRSTQSTASQSVRGVCRMECIASSQLQSVLRLVLLVGGSHFIGSNEMCSWASEIVSNEVPHSLHMLYCIVLCSTRISNSVNTNSNL